MGAQALNDDTSVEVLSSAVGVLTAKWSVAVLATLSSGTRRFTELLTDIDGVSRRMLATTLRQLERDGLVLRHVYARVPSRVEYELSDSGEELLNALAPLLGWGIAHMDDIAQARERYDRIEDWRARSQAERVKSQARIC